MLEKVLITGGEGYVGTLLTPQLQAAGHHVTGYFYGKGVPMSDQLSALVVLGCK